MEIRKLEDVENLNELDDEQIQDFLAEEPGAFLRKFAGQLGDEITNHLRYPAHGPNDDRMQNPSKYGGVTRVITERSKERRQAAAGRRGGSPELRDHLIDVDS